MRIAHQFNNICLKRAQMNLSDFDTYLGKIAKYCLGLKSTDKEGGIHKLESLEWKVAC